MKLNAAWNNEAYDVVMDALHDNGFVGYAVGGCVRDAVVGAPFNDVDVATNARPHDLPKIFGVKPHTGDDEVRRNGGVALYPTGVAHGTWTVRVGEDTVEVTTFRRDVDTDGRRAVVEFADTMEEDAMRRDFTMNSLYCDRFNEVHDPTGTGVADLLAGRVRFVGDADERVREDYLRVMRLFRFHARFGRGPMDTDAWNAASKNRFGLSARVSKERVWDELKKMLSLHAPAEALWEMSATRVMDEVLNRDATALLGALFAKEREYNLRPNWVRRYVAVMQNEEVPFPASNDEKKRVAKAVAALESKAPLSALAHEYGAEAATTAAMLTDRYYTSSDVDRGAMTQFPVSAKDFLDRGYQPGPKLGEALAAAKKYWYSTDLRARKDALVKYATQEVPL